MDLTSLKQISELTVTIEEQWMIIQQVSARLQARADSSLNTPAKLDSAAYQIHNLYGSIEGFLKSINHAFGNQASYDDDGDRLLLLRLSQPIEGIRPAFLSEESCELLYQLRNFRHMFQHTYEYEIEANQLQFYLDKAFQLIKTLACDTSQFQDQLGISRGIAFENTSLASLTTEFAQSDRALAEAGMEDYGEMLRQEDEL